MYTADNGPHSALYEDSKQVLGPTAVPSRCRDRMNRIPVSASGTSDSCSLCTSPLYRHRHAHQFSRQFPQGGYNSEGGGFEDFFRTSNLSSPDVFRSVRPSTPFSADTDTPIFCCQSNTIPIRYRFFLYASRADVAPRD